jgi:hypothetical protein
MRPGLIPAPRIPGLVPAEAIGAEFSCALCGTPGTQDGTQGATERMAGPCGVYAGARDQRAWHVSLNPAAVMAAMDGSLAADFFSAAISR